MISFAFCILLLVARSDAEKRNVLFLLVDDLRPEAAIFGQKDMITPNIDRLGRQGVVFNHAYCQQAICGPTRNSFLSGRRPQRTLSWNFIDHFREVGPDWITFPQWFKEHGYVTLATGKTFHPGLPPNWDEPLSWSDEEPYYYAPNAYPQCDEWPHSYACPNNASYETFSDWMDMNRTRDQIRKYANAKQPFFLTFGAHRPHLPWNVPTKFWDMYGPTENVSLPVYESAPRDMPSIAFTYECDGKTEVIALDDTAPIPYPSASTALPPNMTKTLRRGYFSSVSWTDYLIGELLTELDKSGVANETIVVLIGDHGWQLGERTIPFFAHALLFVRIVPPPAFRMSSTVAIEYLTSLLHFFFTLTVDNIWGKHTNFELGTRVPLIIADPEIAPFVSDALVESVDVYPTIAALAGIPNPPDLDGVDLTPLMEKSRAKIKDAVFSEYPRCPPNVSAPWGDTTSCVQTPRENFTAMGYSVRTMEWRYTVWLYWDGEHLKGDFGRSPIGVELYKHKGDSGADFDAFENVNLAGDPAYKDVRNQLYEIAESHWKSGGWAHIPRARPRVIEESDEERRLRLELWDMADDGRIP